ncbi:MAG: hypothetical protein COX66_03845 [Elusimicrobia bacterium CG_4_10_14_0_2_um_filter_63_34]|nr:MAG: hypothetical protein COX66_03845 [Elusimicrobia bacterium CG_4_10_14_0_2_um_filter_63_34]
MRIRTVLFATLFLLPGAAFATLSGGPYELRRSVVAPGGEAFGGAYRTVYVLRDALGASSSGGSLEGVSGTLMPIPSGASVLSSSAPARVCVRLGAQAGVPVAEALEVTFSVAVEPASLARATTVQAASLADGASAGSVPYTVEFDTSSLIARFVPQDGWREGTFYRVLVGSGVVDLGGSPISEPASAGVVSLLDYSPAHTLSAFDDPTATLELPAGALGSGNGFVIFHSSPAAAGDRVPDGLIAQADARARAAGRPTLRAVEINAYDAACALRSVSGTPVLSLGYADSDADGFVDGRPTTRVRSLALWNLDEDSGNWLRVPGSQVDEAAGVVRAPLQHFSVYALAASPDREVSAAYAYPVPWRPFGGNPARYGTLAGGITFANIPQDGNISVYTLSGELVRRQELTGALKWVWDVRNSRGEPVASGVYLWSVRSGDKAKTGKLMVIR